MDENETRKKSVNAWVFLCLVTKRLANWGELLSPGSHVRVVSGTPETLAPSAIFIFLLANTKNLVASKSEGPNPLPLAEILLIRVKFLCFGKGPLLIRFFGASFSLANFLATD